MGLKGIYPTREDIPEELLPHYAQASDGRWRLQGEGFELEEEIEGLKRTLADRKERQRKAEEKLAAFGELDPEGLADKLSRLEALEAADGDVAEKIQAAVARAKDMTKAEAERDLKKLQSQIARQDQIIQRRVLRSGITDQLRKVGVHDDYVDAVTAELILNRSPKLVDNGDDVTAVLTDDYGSETPVEKFVQSWAETERAKRFLAAKGGGGSGAEGNERLVGPGQIVVSRSDPLAWAKHSKAIQEGKAVMTD